VEGTAAPSRCCPDFGGVRVVLVIGSSVVPSRASSDVGQDRCYYVESINQGDNTLDRRKGR